MNFIEYKYYQVPLKTYEYDLTNAKLINNHQDKTYSQYTFKSEYNIINLVCFRFNYTVSYSKLLNEKIKHRLDGPAYIMYTPDGLLEYYCYTNNINQDIPGFSAYYFSKAEIIKKNKYEQTVIIHKINDVKHKPNGPAEIIRDSKGLTKSYYIYGEVFSKNDYKNIINGIKNETFKPTNIDNLSINNLKGFKLLAEFYNKPNLVEYFDNLILAQKLCK